MGPRPSACVWRSTCVSACPQCKKKCMRRSASMRLDPWPGAWSTSLCSAGGLNKNYDSSILLAATGPDPALMSSRPVFTQHDLNAKVGRLNIHVPGPCLQRRVQLVFHASRPQLKRYKTLNVAATGPATQRVNHPVFRSVMPSMQKIGQLQHQCAWTRGPARGQLTVVHGRLHQLKQYIPDAQHMLRPDTTGAVSNHPVFGAKQTAPMQNYGTAPTSACAWTRGPARVNQLVFHAAGSPAKKI
jgi:hypothetical protein